MALYRNSRFSRIRENEAKLGAYYTDLEHCRSIHKMFLFPEQKEVCVLDPCIGNGAAVINITAADQNPYIKIFGVELNDAVAEETSRHSLITQCLQADFTNDVLIQKESFSFAFGNPPYLSEKDESGEKNLRLERVFLERILKYLKSGAVLVWIVPYSAFCEPKYLHLWCQNFETEAVYRFRDAEYQKYKQIVVVGRKISRRSFSKSQLLDYSAEWNLNCLPLLPDNPEPAIPVFPSSEAEIDLFTTKTFDDAKIYKYFKEQGLPQEIISAFDQKIAQAPFVSHILPAPPIPLKNDSLYLLATSGYGQGLTGSEENRDLHLQRGVAEIVEESYYADDKCGEDEKRNIIAVQTKTQVSMYIVENNGVISVLQ